MGGWVVGWVAGFAENIANSAKLKLELGLSLAISTQICLNLISILEINRLDMHKCEAFTSEELDPFIF